MTEQLQMDSDVLSVERPEFTLEDTLELLKEVQKEKQSELDKLTETIKNNEVHTLNADVSFDDLLNKQQRLLESLGKLVLEEVPQNCPIQSTEDLYITALKGLEDNVQEMEQLLSRMRKTVDILKNDITFLEKKNSGFDKMKEAAQNHTEDEAKNTNEEEYETVKRYFSDVKADLKTVIEIIFPENEGLNDLLVELSKAQLKGGDDVYVEITPESFSYTNFLLRAGIITFHPHDKARIKMVNLL